MSISTLAVIIVAAIFAQLAILLVLDLYRRKQRFHDQAQSREPLSAPASGRPDTSASSLPENTELAWEGYREFQVKRRVVEDACQSICSFYLVPVDGRPLPPFKPGQFLTFKLPIVDPVTHESRTIVRCYSLSDCSSPDHYRVSIKRVPAPADKPGLPPGLSSNYFHDFVKTGSHLMVKAPSGHFHLQDNEPLPVVLIAGGIGITPMLSILNTLLNISGGREIWLYYGVRNSAELIHKEYLLSLTKAHANFHLCICFTNPDSGEVEGVDYQHKGRVDIPLLRTTLKLKRYQFYICGPKPMMESMVPGLEKWGVAADDIFYESFGPATLIRPNKSRSAENIYGQNYTITFSKSGQQILWDTQAGSLLEFAEAHNIEVDSGCRAGSCGSCQTPLQSGEIVYSQQPDADVKPGCCLLCISTPKSDLSLAI